MKLLFIDLETTGLPTSFHINPSETKHWPHIVQIAWIITDYNSEQVLKEREYIIKPTDWEIPKESTRIHKITQKQAEETGVDINIVLSELIEDISDVFVIIAHNIDFDINVLKAEFYRKSLDVNLLNTPRHFCTMINFTDFCEIKKPNSYDYKWPTLEQLHEKVLGTSMAKKHNALADVYAVKFCFYELKKRRYVEFLTDEQVKERKKLRKEQEEYLEKNKLQQGNTGCWYVFKIILYVIVGVILFLILFGFVMSILS